MDPTPTPGIPEELERGMTLVDDKQYDQAIEVFNALLARAPDHAGAYLHRGRCWDREAEHDRAINLVRTGYPITPAIRHPTFGSVVAMKRQDADFELPAFVRIGKPRIATRDVDHGVLGVRYASFNVDTPGELPPDVRPRQSAAVLRRRLGLAGRFDDEFARNGGERNKNAG